MTSDTVSLKDRAAWKAALQTPRPVLAHLNADTTWLLQLPVTASTGAGSPRKPVSNTIKSAARSRYNILIDPWLQGPQSDVASWFSTQWHVVAPCVQTIAELDGALAELEGGSSACEGVSYIDCVVISHEFTDHCHQATLLELPKGVPVIATEKAADLIRSWNHFEKVITTPGFSVDESDWREVLVDKTGAIPPWIGIGRVVTQGNALYYHSAVMIAFDLADSTGTRHQRRTRSHGDAPQKVPSPEAVVYSPHGIKGSDLACLKSAGIKTLALLHGLDDVRIWMTAQLNLGAINGIQAVKASGARYWIATHDEAKKGGGFISWLLMRKSYTLRDAVDAEKSKQVCASEGGERDTPLYDFIELGSGDGMVLAEA